MTAKEYLSQAYMLEQLIKSKQNQLSSLESIATGCSSNITGMPRNPSPSQSPMADAKCRIVDLENELQKELARLINYKIRVLELIHSVQSIECQLILEKRYLFYMPWERIAQDLNYSVGWVMKLHRKSLCVVDEVLCGRNDLYEQF